MNVRHFMMAVNKVLEGDLSALLYPKVDQIAEIPSRRCTLCVHVVWFLDDGISPEFWRHWWEAERGEKLFRNLEYFRRRVSLLYHFTGNVWRLSEWPDEVDNISPVLSPHIPWEHLAVT